MSAALHIDVTAALIVRDGRVLLARRPQGSRHGGRWEFPGGKLEAGESLEACLVREIKEELDLDVEDVRFFTAVDHDYGDFSLTLHAFVCRPPALGGEPPGRGEILWVRPVAAGRYDLLPPDREILGKMMENQDLVFGEGY